MKNIDPQLIANNLIPSNPSHPGKTLSEEIAYRGITTTQLADKMGVEEGVVHELINGTCDFSTEYALLLESALGVDASFWLNLQADYTKAITGKMNRLLEICCGDIDSVLAAAQGGAHRVELCAALSEGGVTPSLGLIRAARQVVGLKLHVLIRPRGGDFVYTPAEVECMVADIQAARTEGADGVVIGALTPEGEIDLPACQRLMEAAKGLSVTFHRAFDLCTAPFEALEQIIALGCHRLLTSGQAATAREGIAMLRELVSRSAGRIIILPAAGVSPDNAAEIVSGSGACELHASARHSVPSAMRQAPGAASMGAADDLTCRKVTSPQLVHDLLRAMQG